MISWFGVAEARTVSVFHCGTGSDECARVGHQKTVIQGERQRAGRDHVGRERTRQRAEGGEVRCLRSKRRAWKGATWPIPLTANGENFSVAPGVCGE